MSKQIKDLIATAKGKVKLNIDFVDEEKDMILIEGDSFSLKFFANLLNYVADNTGDDGLQMGPQGAGSAHFGDKAKFGFYIHKTK